MVAYQHQPYQGQFNIICHVENNSLSKRLLALHRIDLLCKVNCAGPIYFGLHPDFYRLSSLERSLYYSYFDECGLKLPQHGTRNYGHGPIGERAVELTRYTETPNIYC
jgi:hypothetical protein